MIPISAKLKLVLGLILVGGIAALQALAKVEPAWVWAGGVVQFLTALELWLTVPPAAAAKLAAAAKPMGVLLLVLAFGSSQLACNGAVFPTLQKIEQIVQADLEANPPKTDAQIASDVCAALGGSSETDAVCADVEITIADVVSVLIDAGLLSTVGKARGRTYRGLHAGAKP